MRLKSALMGIAVTLAFAVFSPTIARADLLGSEVTGVLLYPNERLFATCQVIAAPVRLGPCLLPPEFPQSFRRVRWYSTVRSPSPVRR
jgi:hypothetical protein